MSDQAEPAVTQGVAPEVVNSEIDMPLGVYGAMALLEIRHEEHWHDFSCSDEGVVVMPGDQSWRKGEQGGDPFDLIALVTGQSRSDAIAGVQTILSPLSEQDRDSMSPNVFIPIDGEQPPFPISVLPQTAREACAHLAQSHGVAPEFLVANALAITGGAIGKGLKLRSVRSMSVFANLYVFASMPPSAGKSATLRPLIAPLLEFERELNKQPSRKAEPATNGIEANDHTSDSKLDKAVTKSERRILVEDISTEAATCLMAANGETLISVCLDARSSIKNVFGRYRKPGKTDEDFYVKAFSSDPVRQDRVTRESVIVNEPVLSLAWAMQPDLFDEVFANHALAESGLLPRILPCKATAQSTRLDYAEISQDGGAVAAFQHLLTELLRAYYGKETSFISASDSARRVLTRYDRQVRSFSHFSNYRGRWGELAWKLALVVHCIERGSQAHLFEVSEESATAALSLMHWFTSHQLAILSEQTDAKYRDKMAIALSFVNKVAGGVTARDLHRAHGADFADSRAASVTLRELADEGSIRCEPGRTSMRFLRNREPK